VSFGDEPAIPPEEFHPNYQRRKEEINNIDNQVFDHLKPWVQIVARDGLFNSFDPIFDARLPGNWRVPLLLEV
jgi:hypothetical protein